MTRSYAPCFSLLITIRTSFVCVCTSFKCCYFLCPSVAFCLQQLAHSRVATHPCYLSLGLEAWRFRSENGLLRCFEALVSYGRMCRASVWLSQKVVRSMMTRSKKKKKLGLGVLVFKDFDTRYLEGILVWMLIIMIMVAKDALNYYT